MDPNLDTQLVEAAKSGNLESFYKLLGSDFSILDRADKQFRENPLHFAVSKNHRLFAAEIANLKPSLARRLNQHGLSPLHIAAEYGQNLEIVKLLLCDNGYFVKWASKINTTNNDEETAFDVFNKANGSQKQPVEEDGAVYVVTDQVQGDERETEKKMRKILKSKGAKSAENICRTLIKKEGSKRKRALDSGIKWLLKIPKSLSFKVDKDTSSEVRNVLLVIFILIVTVTYTTGINPPGGLWSDDSNDGSNNSSSLQPKPHIAGSSIWLDLNPDSFWVLMLCNYFGFLVSVVMVFNLTEGYPLRGPVLLALFLMLLTYGSSIRLLFLGTGPLTVLFDGFILTIPLPLALILLVATANWIWEIKE
ncbi:hypothetical protein NE237_020292 [Protea cynaroides]|uniref:PGG domain-containing protein n=1 Tax=Protea cynaroides TaxID=273540 RepID=A0A9Q0H5R5_9MAGN|nr:hypothetical protein NE237_020292 [Protea cynaroides]